MHKSVIFLGLFGLLSLLGCGPTEPPNPLGEIAVKIKLTSAAFKEGETIPKKHTGDGPDVSPPLAWGEPPEGTKSFALICDDPDAPVGTWVHWVIFNIPADARLLDEGAPREKELSTGARQGKNDFPSDNIGYRGPAPPKGNPHRYFFKLYAVDAKLDLAAGATKDQLVTALKDHVLAEGQLMGKYQR